MDTDVRSISAPRPSTSAPQGLRADIQALRALAVGLVIVNHLWPERLPGGYLGVDIFFVISGYLITSHLRREIDTKGSINLARFWARRARRLLPAAILVIMFSAAVTWWLLPVTLQQSAFQQIGAAGAYVLNWLLASSSLDYFAQGSHLSPVTHYWSLSVEEQFYIFWPLLLLIGLLSTRRRPQARRPVIATTFALVFIGSLLWAIWSTAAEPVAAYFQTGGRAWEFAAGGLLALVPANHRLHKTVAGAASWALWTIVLGCAYVYGSTTGFPGTAALVPVLATVALIWIGPAGTADWSPQRVFTFRPVQWIGDISYSLYLWHWPLIVGAIAMFGHLTMAMKLVILVVVVVLSWLTKRYVEDPVRFSSWSAFQRPSIVIAGTVATVALILGGSAAGAGILDTRARQAAVDLFS